MLRLKIYLKLENLKLEKEEQVGFKQYKGKLKESFNINNIHKRLVKLKC